ncbi:MAG: molybdopterin oxidoreductase, partial [Gammaproteobacteria bacterium]|nr:molybdopterin oxidoreductase [Gammaproteobacteria bacterium]
MGPMFVVMSFAYGLAFFWLVLNASYRMTGRELGGVLTKRLKNLLGVFVAGALYFTIVMHLANLYAPEHKGVEDFILNSGGIYTNLFWYGQILLGAIIPLAILYYPATGNSRCGVSAASLMIILGGIAQMYVTVVGGQAYPLELFPGHEVVSTFSDGVVNNYSPTLSEFLLGIMGIALTLILVTVAVRNLRFLPESLADSVADPHHK